jgi:hypothetical protein
MNHQVAQPKSPDRVKMWLGLGLFAVFIFALPCVSNPIGRDQATYAVIGRGLLHGQALYKDLWDNKPPGIFFIFAAVVRVFGSVMWSVGVVDILWLLAISVLIFDFARRHLDVAPAVVAVIVNAAWHTAAGYWNAAQPETFLTLFVLAAYLLIARTGGDSKSRLLCSGVLFASAFWVKYNAVAFLPLLLLVPFIDFEPLDAARRKLRLRIPFRRWVAAIGWFAAGGALVSAIILTYFALAHSWGEFLQEQFVILPRYSHLALTRTPHYFAWAGERIARWLGMWTVAAFFAAVILAWKRRLLGAAAPTLVAAALALEIRYQPYYFETCYPFFALIWGYLFVEAFRGFKILAQTCRSRNWNAARILVWIAFADLIALCLPVSAVTLAVRYKALAAWTRDRGRFYENYIWPGAAEHFRDALHVVDFLRRHPAPPDGIYVWGNEPLIYFLSGHRPPTRFVWNLELIAPWSLPEWRQELVASLHKSRPMYIIIARDDEVHDLSYTFEDSEQELASFPQLNSFLTDNYREVQSDVTFSIYARLDSEPRR